MSTSLRRVLVTAIVVALAGCGGGGGGGSVAGGGASPAPAPAPSPGGGGTPSPSPVPSPPPASGGTAGQNAGLNQLNALRANNQVSAAAFNSALNTAAAKHGGYQSIEGGITHFETNTSNALFVAESPFGSNGRIGLANGGDDTPAGSNRLSEGVGSVGGAAGVRFLWNTVYHRLPMMRPEFTLIGFGDRDVARELFPAAGVPAGGIGAATLDYAGFSSIQVTGLSHWPHDEETGVEESFRNLSESPRPFGNVDITTGPPIHLMAPTTAAWQTVSMSLTRDGSATPIDCFIMVLNSSPLPNGPAGSTVLADPENDLRRGEIFVMPKAALPRNTRFDMTFDATAVGGARFQANFQFRTR